jgi:hypothetical protein
MDDAINRPDYCSLVEESRQYLLAAASFSAPSPSAIQQA